MNIYDVISNLHDVPLSSEQEVRTKVAIPIIEALGYSASTRAEEFPVYMVAGREKRTKSADIILFNSSEYEKNKSNTIENKNWVYDNSLLIIELKKPSESIANSIEQALSYTLWTRALYYGVTNGEDIAFYKLELNRSDLLVLSCKVANLSENWGKIESEVNYNTLKQIKQNLLKNSEHFDKTYDDYCLSKIQINKNNWNIAQSFVSWGAYTGFDYEKYRNPKCELLLGDLISNNTNYLLLAPSGYGKTYCINDMLEKYSLEYLEHKSNKIPVILQSSLWKRSYNSIEEGIYNELKFSFPTISIDTVRYNLKTNKYVLLVDAIDECRQDVDIFLSGINQLASTTTTKIIITSKQNRAFSLLEGFDVYEVNPLSEEQVNNISTNLLGYNPWILHNANQNLRLLLHTPLFLSMYLMFLEDGQNSRKPKNLAVVYNYYIDFMLTTYLMQKGISSYDSYSKESLKRILAITSFHSLNSPKKEINIDEFIMEVMPNGDVQAIRSLLFGSSIVNQYDELLNFQFESVKEYFFSIYLAYMSETDLFAYIDSNCDSDICINSILLMIGNIHDKHRQDTILNYLEEKHFALYIKCLNTRYNFSNQYENPTQNDCEILFEQILESYHNIINTHFSSLADQFSPWVDLNDKNDKDKYSIAIKGSISLETLYIHVSFSLVPKEEQFNLVEVEYSDSDAPTMTIVGGNDSQPIPFFSFTDSLKIFGYNLKHFYNGIDCAREIAKEIVLVRLLDLLKRKNLLFNEHPFMLCQYVEENLANLPKNIVQSTLKSDEPRLSLMTNSIEELKGIFLPVRNMSCRYGAFYDTKEISFLLLWLMLDKIEENNFDPCIPLLPVEDKFTPPKEGSWYIWEPYKIETLMQWIGQYYNTYQISYRYFANSLFSTLKNDLPLYYSGPVQYHITIYSDNSENEYCTEDYSIRVIWEAKENIDECETVVTLKKKIEEKLDRENEDNFFQKSRQTINFLGRKGYGSGISSHGISLYLRNWNDEYSVRNKVYKKVARELEDIFSGK